MLSKLVKRLKAKPIKKKPLLPQATSIGRYACLVCESNTRVKVCGPCPKCGTRACTKASYNGVGELIDPYKLRSIGASQINPNRRTIMENPRVIRQKLKDSEAKVEKLTAENKKLRAELGKLKPKTPVKKAAKKVTKKKATKKVAKKATKKSAAK